MKDHLPKSWGWALVVVVALLGVAHLGVELLRPSSVAEAQTSFTRCFFARQETVDTNNDARIARPGRDRQINVPRGWTVVGGGAMARGEDVGDGVILLCR